jgi:hypothetical protein
MLIIALISGPSFQTFLNFLEFFWIGAKIQTLIYFLREVVAYFVGHQIVVAHVLFDPDKLRGSVTGSEIDVLR